MNGSQERSSKRCGLTLPETKQLAPENSILQPIFRAFQNREGHFTELAVRFGCFKSNMCARKDELINYLPMILGHPGDALEFWTPSQNNLERTYSIPNKVNIEMQGDHPFRFFTRTTNITLISAANKSTNPKHFPPI